MTRLPRVQVTEIHYPRGAMDLISPVQPGVKYTTSTLPHWTSKPPKWPHRTPKNNGMGLLCLCIPQVDQVSFQSWVWIGIGPITDLTPIQPRGEIHNFKLYRTGPQTSPKWPQRTPKVYLGHEYTGKSSQFHPLIFLGLVRCFIGPSAVTVRRMDWVMMMMIMTFVTCSSECQPV